MGELPNNLGRPRIIEKFSSMFEYFEKYVKPNKKLLDELKSIVYQKEKELAKAIGHRTVQQTKVDNAYNNLEYFKR